jgi:predicted 3-demethylubiquinone-9 3-methyltransferase (glyoxalase superfamily)
MQKITPFLWFDDQAEEAARFYVSVFEKDSKILGTDRYGEAGPGAPGSVMSVRFRLAGQDFYALNGGPVYKLNPAFSLFVDCKTQREIDTLYRKLSAGGVEQRCGWITDRFGLTWQIVFSGISDLIKDQRAMKAMLGMKKLDMAKLKAAAKGRP